METVAARGQLCIKCSLSAQVVYVAQALCMEPSITSRLPRGGPPLNGSSTGKPLGSLWTPLPMLVPSITTSCATLMTRCAVVIPSHLVYYPRKLMAFATEHCFMAKIVNPRPFSCAK